MIINKLIRLNDTTHTSQKVLNFGQSTLHVYVKLDIYFKHYFRGGFFTL